MLEAAMERDKLSRAFEVEMKKFGMLIKDDKAVLANLNKSANKEVFIEHYCKLAAGHGIYFSHDDVLIAVQEQKQGINWVIPKSVQNIIRELF